jgi:hypothetical protein
MAKPLCDDWGCPAAVSCALHYGRSEAYAAMTLPAPPMARHGRDTGTVHCADYRCDKPRAWLLPGAPVGKPNA